MTEAYNKFYINGEWISPTGRQLIDLINPATEEPWATITLGTAQDVNSAASAARTAFATWSLISVEERAMVLENIVSGINNRSAELAHAICKEMGAPMRLATTAQVGSGLAHFATALKLLRKFEFEEIRGTTRIVHEPIGVCGFITPWNWPLNQIACKVAPALATGCTMVLKPSEAAPVSAYLFTEILAQAGVPAGVFNLVNGDGPTVGAAIAAHPEIDMVSFTGSTRAGREVARAAADSIKRVTQELGGKSANLILDDVVDFDRAVLSGTLQCFNNSGQSCNAPTRMLVPAKRMDQAIAAAQKAVAKAVVGDPQNESTRLGPVVNSTQYEKIQQLIEAGIDQGATLVAGGPGRPDGLTKGYYVKPTVFANVNNDMTIATEEIFGPVLCIIPYSSEDQAVAIANDTAYGLSGYVSGAEDHAREVARKLRTGMVHINGAAPDFNAPFGGYKMSGNGREWGQEGFDEFLETKAIMGYDLT